MAISYTFFNTHIGLSIEEREKQIQELLQVTGRKRGKTLLVGDFNAERDEIVPSVAEQFNDVFPAEESILTFPASKPLSRIDYLFTSKDLSFSNASVIETLASDHLPITVEITMD